MENENSIKNNPNEFENDEKDSKSDNNVEFINITINSDKKMTSRSVSPLFLLLRTQLCVFVFFGVLLNSVSAKEQKFAIEPQDQSAVVGSRVTLPCRVVNKAGTLQWTKDDFGLGTHRHLVGFDRYKMVGSDEEGDYSLDIREVTLDDDAQYQCQVSSGPRGEPGIRSRYARLSVLVPPDPPRILQGASIQTIEDQDVSLECVSAGGKPAAEITWVDSEGGVLTQGVTYTVEPSTDGRRLTARSVLSLRPRRHHHNQTFTCQAQNTADRAYKAATIKLEVKYAPKVKIHVSATPKKKLQEGDTLKAVCQATANPNELKFKWFINNEQIVGNLTNEIVIKNVSRKLNEASIKCEVYNAIGKSGDSKTLEVSYGPTFIVKPEDVEGEEDSSVTLKCIVDAHPTPEVTWLRYEKGRMVRVGKSPTLTVSVTEKTATQYWCRATVEGYPNVEAHAHVYLKGPPKIQSNKTQYGVEGDSVRIDCISFSVPKPDSISWWFGGIEINPYHNNEFVFLEESLQEGLTKSTLIVKESESRHFGLYNCTVTNAYGTDTIQIHLIADKSFPMIVIISGGASSAILVLMILLIIMLCHRKRRKSLPSDYSKKPDLTDVKRMEKGKDCDRHSTISDLKIELRQVEGCDTDATNTNSNDMRSTRLNSNTGLSLAGPVTLQSAYDSELMKTYHRFSADFSDTSSAALKLPTHGNGYIPYVDYTRDYIPPSVHSSEASSQHQPRSIDTSSNSPYERSGSLQRLAGCGPDVIPMTNAAMCMGSGVDIRYAATYGNPYLRIGQMPYLPHVSSATGVTPAPPPYYTIRSPVLPLPVTTVTSPSGSSRSLSSVQAPSSTSSGAQPQVPKMSTQSPALFVLPTSSQGSPATQITTKGKASTGTHV